MEKPIVPSRPPPGLACPGQIKFAEVAPVPLTDIMEGEGGSEFRFRMAGRPAGSIRWRAIYFSDLVDIVAYFMRAARRPLLGGVGVVDRTEKPDALVSRPNRT